MKTTTYLSDDDDEYLDQLDSGDESEDEIKEEPGSILSVLKGKLPPPRSSPLSTKQLHEFIHFGNVELNPDYQRDVVWNPTKMVMLIQSLFLNYYVPPVIFAKSTRHDGEEVRVAIDGKQRCTSILWFVEGRIPFVSPHTKEKFYYKSEPGARARKALPANLKRMFDTITIQCVEYDGIDEETQRDIFQRVQLGMALNSSEKLAAIPGPWSKWIIAIQKRFIDGDYGLSGLLDWDIRRSAPFKTIAAGIVLASEPDRRRPPTSQYLTKFIDRSDGPAASFQKKMETTFALFVNIATEHHDIAFKSVKSARIAPVEFWFIVLLIFRRMGSTSIRDLAKAIGDLRKHVRSKHKDIFSNSKVVDTLYDWLDNLPVAKPGRGEEFAAQEFAIEDVEDPESMARKRKRERREEEEDPDFNGPAVKRGVESAPTENLRSKVNTAVARPPTSPKNNRPAQPQRQSFQPTRPQPVTQPAIRPPPPSMDAPIPNPYAPGPSTLPPRPNPQQVDAHQMALMQQAQRNQMYASQFSRPPQQQGQGQGQQGQGQQNFVYPNGHPFPNGY